MTTLHFTDMAALCRSVEIDGVRHSASPDEIEAAQAAYLIDGMPFILGSDHSYDHNLNLFLRSCPTMGVRSLNSLRSYARDLVVWIRFLEERREGKTIWVADRDDIAAFYQARRMSQPPHRISAATWNRSLAALDKFYGWASEQRLIRARPFTYKKVLIPPRGVASFVVESNCARDSGARVGNVHFLSVERYLLFREVGLRGRLPDGREDPGWHGRNGDRNALFAELLITTGLRLQEGASLLTVELPSHTQGHGSVPFRLAGAIAKGNKGRDIWLPRRLVKLLHEHVALERANVVARDRARNSAPRIRDPIMVLDEDRRSVTIADGARSGRARLDLLSPRERVRLLNAHSNEPLSLWLKEGGTAMSMGAWQMIFRRASERCQQFNIDIYVTPHMLRHSFAVHMLTLLLKEQIGWVVNDRRDHTTAAYRQMISDPLRTLQRMLGHSQIESTYIYLDHLDDSQALVDAAVSQWGADTAFRETVA
jgi:site-specific recombinase XerD